MGRIEHIQADRDTEIRRRVDLLEQFNLTPDEQERAATLANEMCLTIARNRRLVTEARPRHRQVLAAATALLMQIVDDVLIECPPPNHD